MERRTAFTTPDGSATSPDLSDDAFPPPNAADRAGPGAVGAGRCVARKITGLAYQIVASPYSVGKCSFCLPKVPLDRLEFVTCDTD